MPSQATRLLARFAGYVATFFCLHVISAVAIAQSCTPAAPRIDSGAGFVPFGANEQVLARAGNSGPAWEWAVGTDTDAGQKVQGSLDWVSGRVYRWKLVNSGSGSAMLEIRDAGDLRLSLSYPVGMDAGNALELWVGTNPSIGPEITIDAGLTRLNGFSVSGSLSQSGTRSESGQALYYYFPQMAQGFTAEGTVRLTFPKKRPTGSRVQFAVRAGTIPCSSGGNPPTVSITAPAANTVFTAPATITVAADAQYSDGTVTQVVFFANGNSIGAATSSPFMIQWTNVKAGAYSLTAVATGSDGSQTSSASVPITVGAAQALHFIHVDHLSTPRLIADAAQKTVWRWEQQEPFGSNAAIENPDGNEIAFSYSSRFPGQYYDVETLHHYNYFRNYDATIGRYVESDPIGLVGGLNTYGYVGSMPIAFADPTGEIFVVPVLLASILSGGSAAATTTSVVVTVATIGATVGAVSGALQVGQSIGWCAETAPDIAFAAVAGFGIGGIAGLVSAPLGIGGTMLAGGLSGFAGSLSGSIIGGQPLNTQTFLNATLSAFMGMISGFAALPAYGPLVVANGTVPAAVFSGATQLGLNSIVSTNSGGFGFVSIVK